MSIEINGKPLGAIIKDAMKSGESVMSVNGSMIQNGRTTIITGGSVVISRNGKKHVLRGNNIIKKDGQWYVDGKAVDWKDLGGKYEEEQVVSIEITGTVQNLCTTMADVVVHGDCQNVKTGSGDVQCENAVNINTGSGDVHCGDVAGMVSTGSGNVYRK